MGRTPVSPGALAPLGEMNTTPLIDVLLVLLVMLIVTIPAQTHSVKFDLSAPWPRHEIRSSNLITVDANGMLAWNGEAVDRRELGDLLAAASQMDAAPEIHVRPSPDAKHGDVDRLIVMIKQEQIRHFGFVGNEQYRNVF